jgi:hypothetical protein
MKVKVVIFIFAYKVKGQKRTMYQRISVLMGSSYYVYRHEMNSSIPDISNMNNNSNSNNNK